MTVLIAAIVCLAIVMGWLITWWGSRMFEVTGVARRIERAIDRRYAVKDGDGIGVAMARGAWAGVVQFVLVWGGFFAPGIVLAVIVAILD
jgi:hypothetical protein